MAYVRALVTKMKLNCPFGRVPTNGNASLLSTVVSDGQTEKSPTVKPFEDIPGPKGFRSWPVIGGLLYFKPFTNRTIEEASTVLNEMIDKYGPIVKLQLDGLSVMISDPRDVETVFRNEEKYPSRRVLSLAVMYAKRNNLKGAVADVQGEEWYALRSPLNKQLMRVNSTDCYLPQQNEAADEFVNLLTSQKIAHEDMADIFYRFAAESIAVVCFKTRLGFLNPLRMYSPDAMSFLNNSKALFTCLYKNACGESWAHNYYRNKTYRVYEQASLSNRKITMKHVEECQKTMESQKKAGTFNPDEPNLIYSLLSDGNLSCEDICNNVQMLFTAGTHSTAQNLMVFLFHLAKNPDKQEILREEVIKVIGRDQAVTPESMENMPYLKAALKESFRLVNPTGAGSTLLLPRDVVLSGYRVPAGICIQIHMGKYSRSAFSEPDKFLPERWLRSSEIFIGNQISKFGIIPFGIGTRNCVGRRVAMQEIYTATAKLLQKVKIGMEAESFNTVFNYELFPKPDSPIKFNFTKLDN